MSDSDLPVVAQWLTQSHVAQWWTSEVSPDQLISEYQRRVSGDDRRTTMLMISFEGQDIGWCQW